MWISQERAETTLCKPSRAFGRALAMAALMTGLVLGTATFAMAGLAPHPTPSRGDHGYGEEFIMRSSLSTHCGPGPSDGFTMRGIPSTQHTSATTLVAAQAA